METYLSGSQIHVFPSSIDRELDPLARVLSEENLLSFIKGAMPQTSFVISEEYNTSSPFEFVINGYYVVIRPNADNSEKFSYKDVYAHIRVKDGQLDGSEIDNNFTFTAVTFTDSQDRPDLWADEETNDTHHFLHILTKDATSKLYVIPENSKKRVNVTVIDGGVV